MVARGVRLVEQQGRTLQQTIACIAAEHCSRAEQSSAVQCRAEHSSRAEEQSRIAELSRAVTCGVG